jgi:hypothetical protein
VSRRILFGWWNGQPRSYAPAGRRAGRSGTGTARSRCANRASRRGGSTTGLASGNGGRRDARAPTSSVPAPIEEYRECGWTITPYGRPDAGVTTGPCGRCRQPTLLYGPNGRALCVDCEGDT